MIQKIKIMLTIIGTTCLLLSPIAISNVAHAASGTTSTTGTTGSLCAGSNLQLSPGSGTCPVNSSSSLNNVIKLVLNLFSVVVGIVAVIMIVVGGFKYIISGGESGRVSGAKDTILFAIIGLVVVALAQIIVHFVLSSVSTQISGGG